MTWPAHRIDLCQPGEIACAAGAIAGCGAVSVRWRGGPCEGGGIDHASEVRLQRLGGRGEGSGVNRGKAEQTGSKQARK